ncbi:DUF4249 domain-containing protein [Parabacteroides sp. PF5-9]|uniref:DUF4249 domain-containing protein n=1 Tax=Parabacteroides sp. PF5-9 TaxID=1742404 RepID=UPI0024765ECE|nr:DUF4249 domain-containing protein [Parabacteroides sp. PF5-9]MDH6359045.1 hypothetical protein [Parabacteroides sp. PF5-9]
MMRFVHTLFPAVFLILFISCNPEIRIKIDPSPPKLVLYTSASPDKDVSAHVTKSWFITDKQWEVEVGSVKIDVYINNVYRGTMQPVDRHEEDTLSVKGLYALPGCRVEAGDKLEIVAEAPGFDVVRGETTLPDYTEILSVDTISGRAVDDQSDDESLICSMRFRDKSGEKNYYRFLVRRVTEYHKGDTLITTTNEVGMFGNHYYSHLFNAFGYANYGNYMTEVDGFHVSCDDPILNPMSNNPLPEKINSFYSFGAFSDDLIDGREYALKSTLSAYNTYSYQSDALTAIVHYDFILLSVSEPYYQYMKAVWTFYLNGWDIESLREPMAAYSNVANGYGIVAGYQLSTKRITMPFSDTVPIWNPFDQ